MIPDLSEIFKDPRCKPAPDIKIDIDGEEYFCKIRERNLVAWPLDIEAADCLELFWPEGDPDSDFAVYASKESLLMLRGIKEKYSNKD